MTTIICTGKVLEPGDELREWNIGVFHAALDKEEGTWTPLDVCSRVKAGALFQSWEDLGGELFYMTLDIKALAQAYGCTPVQLPDQPGSQDKAREALVCRRVQGLVLEHETIKL